MKEKPRRTNLPLTRLEEAFLEDIWLWEQTCAKEVKHG